MPEIHYRDRFLQAELGPVVVRLARRVRKSVCLTIAGHPLALDRIKELEANEFALPEDDLQDFLKSVGEIGGYQGDQSYQSLSALFTLDTSEVGPAAQDSDTSVFASEPPVSEVVVDEALNTNAVPSADAEEVAAPPIVSGVVSEEVVPSAVFVDVVPVEVPSPTKKAATGQKRRNHAPKVHPGVPGLRLQADGYYWNPKWGDV